MSNPFPGTCTTRPLEASCVHTLQRCRSISRRRYGSRLRRAAIGTVESRSCQDLAVKWLVHPFGRMLRDGLVVRVCAARMRQILHELQASAPSKAFARHVTNG